MRGAQRQQTRKKTRKEMTTDMPVATIDVGIVQAISCGYNKSIVIKEYKAMWYEVKDRSRTYQFSERVNSNLRDQLISRATEVVDAPTPETIFITAGPLPQNEIEKFPIHPSACFYPTYLSARLDRPVKHINLITAREINIGSDASLPLVERIIDSWLEVVTWRAPDWDHTV